MKPPIFEYFRPKSIEEAVSVRADHDYSAILAGGQSLIPTMNFRIANPTAIIDISRIDSLAEYRIDDSQIVIGAMVRQRDIELSDSVYKVHPLIRETLEHVAHVPIRCRGTVAGSLAHADAAAELPALLLVSNGCVVAHSASGARIIDANELFQFHMTTSLADNEIITEVRIPVMHDDAGWAFLEFTRRHGDYAVAGVAVILRFSEDGICEESSIASCGIGSRAVRLPEAEAVLLGKKLDSNIINEASQAGKEYVSAADDTHATTEFRQHVLSTILSRAINIAKSRARYGSE
tara:strand:- start:81174 stop:82049 length:876 start_codon:yes stop_codon:yes gene_type:complete